MRVIIACAGSARWEREGVPRHLISTARGLPLLWRTAVQALRVARDVHVTTPDDDRYALPPELPVTRHVREPEGNEYTSTRDLWSTTGRTVLMLGDVYFTDAAIDSIASGSPTAYRAFGRYRASKKTGTPYGEIFAAAWGAERHAAMDQHLAEVARLRAAGECMRPAGWVLLRLWQGTPPGKHLVRAPYWTEIDDWTDDLDGPADYDRHPAFGGGAIHARR
jgi:hypothetical protein